MKINKLLLVLLFAIALSGCKEYGEKRIVKLLTVDREYVTVYYYDYNAEEPSYKTEKMENKGIENTFVKLLSENDYDLKLCKYAVLSDETAQNQIYKVFNALNQSKFSPDIKLVVGDTFENCEKYIESDNTSYPLYSYGLNNGNVTAIIQNADNGQRNIIIDSMQYTVLNKQQGYMLDVLCKNISNGVYGFTDGEKEYSADLGFISTFYCVESNTLKVNIAAMMKSYKGIVSDNKNRKVFKQILAENMEQTAVKLLNDSIIIENFGLDWYSKIKPYNSININVYII